MKQLVDGNHQLLYPDDGQRYNWNEETTSWDLVDNS
jgi:hypothetical protein